MNFLICCCFTALRFMIDFFQSLCAIVCCAYIEWLDLLNSYFLACVLPHELCVFIYLKMIIWWIPWFSEHLLFLGRVWLGQASDSRGHSCPNLRIQTSLVFFCVTSPGDLRNNFPLEGAREGWWHSADLCASALNPHLWRIKIFFPYLTLTLSNYQTLNLRVPFFSTNHGCAININTMILKHGIMGILSPK